MRWDCRWITDTGKQKQKIEGDVQLVPQQVMYRETNFTYNLNPTHYLYNKLSAERLHTAEE